MTPMIYKTIYFPQWLMSFFHMLSFIFSLATELLVFLLTTFIWIRLKFYVAVFLICTAIGCYWCFIDKKGPFLLAAIIFVSFVVLTEAIKLLRKLLNKFDCRLTRFYHAYPLVKIGVVIPVLTKTQQKNIERSEKL